MFNDDDRRWIDESLREVHIPAELIARLKTVGEDHDSLLDGALCAVPVPDRLLALLKDVPRDERQGASLRSVPVSAEFLSRLKTLPAEKVVDAALCDVTRPAGLTDRLKTIPSEAVVRFPARLAFSRLHWAAAAAVLVIASTIYFATANRQEVVDAPNLGSQQRRGELVQNDQPARPDENGTESTGTAEAVEPPVPVDPVLAENSAAEPQAVEPERPSTELPEHDIGMPDDDRPIRLGMPGRLLPPPPAARPPRLLRRGITPPAVREFDLLGLARTGVHPFVSPGAHPQLISVAIPIVTTTGSFDTVHAAFQSGRTPDRSEVRTEEFLTAVTRPPLAPHAADDVSVLLSARGGPSPWSDARRFLIKIDLWTKGDVVRDALLVAEEVRLKVMFRSEAVKQYRLLGHEADVAGGLLPGPLRANLRAGEISTAVFEIELQPIPIGDLATVQYSWREPDGGDFHEELRRIRRSQLAPTFVEVDPPLQLATIAAATAELLRESPHLSARFAVPEIIALTDAIHPSLYDDVSLGKLLDMLEALE